MTSLKVPSLTPSLQPDRLQLLVLIQPHAPAGLGDLKWAEERVDRLVAAGDRRAGGHIASDAAIEIASAAAWRSGLPGIAPL